MEIVLLSLLASALVTFMEWVLIYRTEGFADLTAEIDRTQKDLDRVRDKQVSIPSASSAASRHSNKQKTLEERKKVLDQRMNSFKMKSMFAVSVVMISFMAFLNSIYEGRVVAKLPFLPVSLVASLTHRTLPGEDMYDCSLTFLYICSSIVFKTAMAKLCGFKQAQASFMPSTDSSSSAFSSSSS